MPGTIVDLSTWNGADQFRHFRTYQRPQYALTSRIDVSRLIARKAQGVSPYRACIYAIGAGIHAVPELLMRFRGETVTLYDGVELSMTVPLADGGFNYAYVPWQAGFDAFDATCRARIEAASQGGALNANKARDDLAYLSCLPWLDFTSINNAMPGPEDCIPRVSWGRFVESGGRTDVAMTIEVHHALVAGRQLGDYFAAVQEAIGRV